MTTRLAGAGENLPTRRISPGAALQARERVRHGRRKTGAWPVLVTGAGRGSLRIGYSVTIEVQDRGLDHLALRLAGALADTFERCIRA